MKKIMIRILFAGALLICTVGVILLYQSRKREQDYQYALELIEAGEFQEATHVLYELPDGYKDIEVLRIYADGRRYNHAVTEHYYMQMIPDDYAGDLSEEILSYKEQNHIRYVQVMEEMEEKAAEYEKKEEQRQKERREQYASKYPYYGMREKDLPYCILGKPVSVTSCEDFDSKKISKRYRLYHFGKSDEPNSGVITVRYWYYSKLEKEFVDLPSDNGYADYGIYYDADGILWEFTERGTVRRRPYTPGSGSHSSNKPKNDDPYNVQDYSDPEDFYEDWEDDFDSFEDAEEYWENGGG